MQTVINKGSFLLLLVLSVVSLGCGTAKYGSPEISDLGRYMSLQKGESTRRSVHGVFGQPYDVVDQAWVYYKIQERMNNATLIPFIGVLAGGFDIDVTILRITFNAAGQVGDIETKTVPHYLNQWVAMTGYTYAPSWGTVEIEERVKTEMATYGLPYDKALAEKRRSLF